MKRNDFQKLTRDRMVVLDGATGTELIRRGMPAGVSPELWVLEHPEVLLDMQRDYRAAGCDIVYTCTFGANPFKLREFGAEKDLAAINRRLAELSREAVGADGLVFGDLAPTGRLVEPSGDAPFEEVVEGYKAQVRALLEGGVDGFVIETMMDIQEARAALLAVRENCDLPALASLTFGEDGRTLSGTDPTAALITLQALGADAVGCNCSTGPEDMLQYVQSMRPHATVPLLAKPNAGSPRLVNEQTVFEMDPATFASFVDAFRERGVTLLGGCCGTTAEHMARVVEAARKRPPHPPACTAVSAVSSARRSVFFGPDRPTALIGERINPTGKKDLKAELRAGKTALVRQYALDQAQAGADLLDVNMGVSGIDEKGMMLEAIRLCATLAEAPLAIDTTHPEVMEAALRLYPGRALVNSVSAERVKLEKTLPIAAKYGAMLIVLPLTDEGIPETAEARAPVVRRILDAAAAYGYGVEDLLVDGLAMTVSADPQAAPETLRFLEWVTRETGANTLLGVSNVSFGLPARTWLNGAFLAMAMDRGLDAVITNPCDEAAVALKQAADVLTGRDKGAERYIRRFSGAAGARPARETRSPKAVVEDCVVYGDAEAVGEAVDRALEAGEAPRPLVDEVLIPAITRVGEMFDRKEYFLPQLLMSAEAMKKAFDRLAPHLQDAGGGPIGGDTSVILATVKGDIHDIGKNLVGLMLRNYGFRVVDLGKDVSAEDIVAEAKKHNARVVGLSALMTTTMVEMREVIDLARKEGLETRFMVGGAVVDQDYADAIGAAGYAPDAIGAVRLTSRLVAPEGE